jgi:hypothetical protein
LRGWAGSQEHWFVLRFALCWTMHDLGLREKSRARQTEETQLLPKSYSRAWATVQAAIPDCLHNSWVRHPKKGVPAFAMQNRHRRPAERKPTARSRPRWRLLCPFVRQVHR